MALTATYDAVNNRVQLAGTALGAGATQVYVWRSYDNFTTSAALRGGIAAPMSGGVFNIDDYEFEAGRTTWYQMTSYNGSMVQQASFTTGPATYTFPDVWLKVPAAPFLNQPVEVMDRSEVTRKSRAGVFPIVGRSNPVMVGDIASSISYTLTLLTSTAADESNLDYLFASGEVVFVHIPSTVAYLQGGYFSVGDSSRAPVNKVSALRVWTIPLTGVAAPGPDVIGPIYTWTSVLADYATWTALLAANATWNDLLQRTGTPSDVIVP